MGLLSFIKGVGEKIFKGEAATVTADTETSEPLKASALLSHVKALGLPYIHLSVNTSADQVVLEGEVAKQEDAEKIVLAVGNVEGVQTVDNRIKIVQPAAESRYHTVIKGDTLSKIALDFYGDVTKYPVIFEANKPMLKNPDLIYPGQVLRVPTI